MSNHQSGWFRYLIGGGLIFIGIVILLQKLDIIGELAWSFWPVVLILIGVAILAKRR